MIRIIVFMDLIQLYIKLVGEVVSGGREVRG